MRCTAVIERKVVQNDRLLRPAMAGLDPNEPLDLRGHERQLSITQLDSPLVAAAIAGS